MTKTIRSQSNPTTRYFLTIDDETGLATDCACPDRHFCPNRAGGCKHMKDFNAQMRRTTTFQQLWHALDFRSEAQRAARRQSYCIEFAIYE